MSILDGTSPTIDLRRALSVFFPNSGGDEQTLSALSLVGANQIFPFLCDMLRKAGKNPIELVSSKNFCGDLASAKAAEALKRLFDAHKSDKATHHDYHLIYGALLKEPRLVSAVLEIGIGSNNPNMPSRMDMGFRPGASLRAFRDFLPYAAIFGADVDSGVLFQEERIRTFYVNQLDRTSFSALESQITQHLDLIVDDGLHAPSANISVLIYAVEKLKAGGWFVAEDIAEAAVPVWQVVAALLPPQFRCQLIVAKSAFVFAVEKLT